MKNIKIVKIIITIFFLLGSAWISFLIFEREFATKVLAHTADSNNYENTLMILLIGTLFSTIGILCMGLMAMFTRYVFVKLIFVDEIREAAYLYYIGKRRKDKIIKEEQNIISNLKQENTDNLENLQVIIK
jgi:small basic protein